MKVQLNDIVQILNDLISEKKTREEVSKWALVRQQAYDNDALVFDPCTKKKEIWNAIIFLIGVDLKDYDGSYLHSQVDFQDYKQKFSVIS